MTEHDSSLPDESKSPRKPVPAENETQSKQPFPSTHWSLIEGCQDPEESHFRVSLETLCNRYWPPVYFYIRRNWNKHPEEAKDLCQAFFLQFLEKDFVRSVDAEKGRFRNFVCTTLRHFLSNVRRDANRQVRHPQSGPLLSIDFLLHQDIPFDVADPAPSPEEAETLFHEDWKKTVVHNALKRLREYAQEIGKPEQAEAFARYRIEYTYGQRPTRKELSRELGLTEPQVNYGLQWASSEFTRILKAEIREQVSSHEDYESEMSELFG
ncbi:MAG: sigma-70 family RNA polymerase sigma factor [Planctomycetota bacterium]|jgi:RNA polymerase sigma-70 factor (ECF subfamily)|nr:sigma-70 family RNA polymerase sigma factor [Planctomycetota bacterium]